MIRKKSSGQVKGNLIFFALMAFAFAGYIFYTSIPQTSSSSSYSERAIDVSKGVKTYALKSAINSWPNIKSQHNNIVPYSKAEDLLAKNYYVVLDASGSMEEKDCANGKTKMVASINALEQFLQGAPKGANFGLSIFHRGQFQELVKLSQTTDWKQVMQKLRRELIPQGGTPLASATRAAQRKLEDQGLKQLGYGEYNLVLITDGMAGQGQNPESVVKFILQESPINLNVIGFCINENNILNQPGFIQYRTATDPESLKQSLQDVLAESPNFNVSDFNQ